MAVQAQALFGASSSAPTDDLRIERVVSILIESAERGTGLCTGILLGNRFVLTAAHCVRDLAIGDLSVRTGPDAFNALAMRRPVALTSHPDLDVAIIEVAPLEVEAPPLALQIEAPICLGMMQGVISGYGLTETGEFGVRHTVIEAVHAVEDDYIVVHGEGVRGGCRGDSGAPLFIADEHGELQLAGVLSSGSASCVGIDRFVRLDRVAPWLQPYL